MTDNTSSQITNNNSLLAFSVHTVTYSCHVIM